MNELIDQVTPYLISLAATILTFLAVKANAYMKVKTGLEIEAINRQALHSALETGVELAIAKATKNKTAATAAQEELVAMIVEYVKRSVPDALETLRPSREQLQDMAIAKVEQRLPKDVSTVINHVFDPDDASRPTREEIERIAKIISGTNKGVDVSAIAKAGW